MRKLLLILALAVSPLGLGPVAPASPCLNHTLSDGPTHSHVASSAASAARGDDLTTAAAQAPGGDDHGARPAAEGCCPAAPSLIQGVDADPVPFASAHRSRPGTLALLRGGRRSFDIFRPPATA